MDEAQHREGDTKEDSDTTMHGDGFDFGEPRREEEDSKAENHNDRHRGEGKNNRSFQEE